MHPWAPWAMWSQRPSGLGGVMPVLDHVLRPTKQHLANFVDRHHALRILRIDDPDLDIRQRHAD